jgi:two-component system alkaline phosphatase synthesis response regulator PhoP
VRDDEIDRVLGLEIGADDYVTKPFSVRELLARVNVQLRRCPARTNKALARYCFDNIDVDFERFRATRKGKVLDLTSKEFDVLRFLINSRGNVVTRDQMLNKVWGYQANPTTRTVDNHILKLRQKLEVDPANPRYILSIYGEGYKFIA